MFSQAKTYDPIATFRRVFLHLLFEGLRMGYESPRGGGGDESTLYISVKHFVSSTLNVVALRE